MDFHFRYPARCTVPRFRPGEVKHSSLAPPFKFGLSRTGTDFYPESESHLDCLACIIDAAMPSQAIGDRAVRSEAGEENHSDHPASPMSPTTTTASPPTKRGQGGNSSRKRRRQEQPASELRYPRRRSLKACRLCRARKTKCDNVQPTCGFCSSISAACSYGEGQTNYSS